MRLLGLGATTAAVSTAAQHETFIAPETRAQEMPAQIETPSAVEAVAQEAVTETPAAEIPSDAQTELVETETPKPQIGEIKLTGDDYDYSDVGGQVTDEMKAQLEAEASSIQSVEDEVAVAMRLLGLGATTAAVSTAAQHETFIAPETRAQEMPAQIETPSAVEAVAQEAVTETPAAEIASDAQAQPKAADESSADLMAKLAAASSAAVAAKMFSERAEQEPETPPAKPPETRAPRMPEESAMPDWLSELAPPQSEATETTDTQVPDWLSEINPVAVAAGAAALGSELPELDETERGELPDWLREPIAPPQAETQTAEAQLETESEAVPEKPIEQAIELPAWMREGIPPPHDPFEVVETSGPLAGVSGILPLALALTEPHILTPPPPTRSEGGRIFQTLLAEPLAASAPPQAEAKPKSFFASKHLLYLLVLLAALIALLLPAGADELGLLGKDVVNSPSAVFYDQLNALPASSVVLMAFDYPPGYGPEMDPAAQAILETLAKRRIGVIALSTNPNSIAIAQSLLLGARETYPEFTFVNLGFIPGSEAGIKALALGWLPAAYPDVNGVPWSATPFARGIRSMDDASAIILLEADNPNLQMWMTQVQPIVKTPILAATTAAIDPQARVYVNARQLSASLRGLTGAAELELWSGSSGQAVKLVNALSFISILLAGIIIFANVMIFIRRSKK